MNRLAVLTPRGNAAIAVIAVAGPSVWPILAELFQPHGGRPLSANARVPGFWFGRFGTDMADEIILLRRSPEEAELHCHGGSRAIAWIVRLLRDRGIEEVPWADWPMAEFEDPVAGRLLPSARTLRTASILLDQARGAWIHAQQNLTRFAPILARNARVGRHLVEPWVVVVAGLPNAGKSTLVNALAGFTRSVVSPVPGTTRDVVSVSLALDGWPVDLVDTAGLRESVDELEEAGIERARSVLAACDLILWLRDAVESPSSSICTIPGNVLPVWNKCDLLPPGVEPAEPGICISAATGQGIPDLVQQLVQRLVPNPPLPGEPVPYTPESCGRFDLDR